MEYIFFIPLYSRIISLLITDDQIVIKMQIRRYHTRAIKLHEYCSSSMFVFHINYNRLNNLLSAMDVTVGPEIGKTC